MIQVQQGSQILAVTSPMPPERRNRELSKTLPSRSQSRSDSKGSGAGGGDTNSAGAQRRARSRAEGERMIDPYSKAFTSQFDFKGFRGQPSPGSSPSQRRAITPSPQHQSFEKDTLFGPGAVQTSLAGGTPSTDMSWTVGGGTQFSRGVRKLQKELHRDHAMPFTVMQDTLMMQREAGADCKTQLKESLLEATGQQPPDEVVEELVSYCNGKDDFQFGELADALWQDDLVRSPGNTQFRTEVTPNKYFFNANSISGFYNDNVEPSVRMFGVKRASSSVKYDLFTNASRREIFNSPVPPEITKQVQDSVHMVPDQHPVTQRPMDPYLSYMTMKQGRRYGLMQRNLPINIITVQPLENQASGVDKEWKSLPTFSLAFSKLHTGHLKGMEWRNRVF